MEIIYLNKFEDSRINIDNLSLVLGNFDGVHIGHSQLISFAKSMTQEGNLAVLTFDKSLKANSNSYLTNLNTKIKLMEKLGVDYLLIVKVSEKFRKISYVDFVNKVLKVINPIKIFCGTDFKYGYNALGDVSFLKERFSEVYVLNYVTDHFGNKISSSSIKELLIKGDIKNANRWLGREYLISGKIVHGKGNGKKFGFPTANLECDEKYVIPKNGVYITKCVINGFTFNSITNIGINPTIDDSGVKSIETHIINFNNDLYGQHIDLIFLDKIRDEIKFDDIDSLKERVKVDIDEAIHYFDYNKFKNN